MALSIQDQGKLIAAGFKIFRIDEYQKRIKIANKPGCWRTYKKIGTQRECKETWDFLMMNDMYISG